MPNKITSIVMAKGGVGKSITALNLSAALELSGKKVLLVDCDPQQGNATLYSGHTPNKLKFTIANIISSFLDLGQVKDIDKTIISLPDGFDLLPANAKLEAIQNRLIAEQANAGIFGDENSIPSHSILKHILSTIRDDYEFIIIDCPPSVSMLTINALVASDSVLLPMEAHYESYEALKQTLDVVSRIKANWNPALQVEGILITKYQSRTNLCRDVSRYTEENYGDKMRIFSDAIPYSIKAAELSSVGTCIFRHDPNGEVAAAYDHLAKEVLENV